MQAVMASTFGTNSPHSRIASGWQACCCSGVYRARLRQYGQGDRKADRKNCG
jgi:hypothetical protein